MSDGSMEACIWYLAILEGGAGLDLALRTQHTAFKPQWHALKVIRSQVSVRLSHNRP